MKENIISTETSEKTVLVGLITPQQNEAIKAKEYLDELAFLADTAGAITEKTFPAATRLPPTRAPMWERESLTR